MLLQTPDTNKLEQSYSGNIIFIFVFIITFLVLTVSLHDQGVQLFQISFKKISVFNVIVIDTICMNKRPTKMKNKQSTLMTNKQRKNLTPNCKQLYSQVLKFKRKQDILFKKNLNIKCRLKLAKQFTNSPLRNQLMDKVNSTTLNFILTQIKIQKRKIEGRRYTLNDKITALSIYKTSPKCYKFLSSLFALPSKKTLSNLLQKIKFHSGVNNHIINNLKYQAEKLEQLDKNCTLLFDDMALGTV